MSAEGSVLNERYRLDRLIGQGGFARVFLATDLLLRRQVAVKVLDAGLTAAGDEGDFLARFEREAQAVAALEHPNILGVYDYGRAAGTVYLVMPFVEGGSLHDRLRAQGRLAPDEAAAFIGQAAAALDYAHRRALVHRDIKPQNMLLRVEDDRLLLADFGIAKVLGRSGTDNRTGIVGTLSYMAPEQFQGAVSRATDIYALGCVLFQLLTGRLPFGGVPEQVMYGHVFGHPPPLDERGREWSPPELQAVVDRALAKEPSARFTSAGELAGALAAAVTKAIPPAVAVPHTPLAPARPNAPLVPPGLPDLALGTPTAAVKALRPPPPASPPAGTDELAPVRPPAPPPPLSPSPARGSANPRPGLLAGAGAALALLLLAALGIGAFAADRWTRDAGTGGTPSPAGTAIAALTPAPPALQPTSAPSPISAATPPSAPSLTAPAQLTAGPTPAAPATPPLAAQGSVAAERALAALPGTTSAIVVAGGVATGRDAERRMPAASLIKLFIAGETYRQVAAGQLGLTDRFTVRQSDVVGGTGILQRQVGATYTLDEMVEIMLVESDNTAANMLIDRLGGFAPVNGFITGLGLSEGTRLNRRLLDTAAQARGIENTTTARDVASFYEQLRAGQVVNPTASRRIVDILARRAGRDRNWLLLDLPPGAGVAHINGTNPGVRNDAAIITGEAGPYILVVLVQHADEAAAERAIARVSLDIYNANRR